MTHANWLIGPTVVAAMLALSGCGRSAESATRPETPDRSAPASSDEGAPPTHDYTYNPEALFFGTLEGTVDCLWLNSGDHRSALILRSGSTSRQDGDAVVLLEDGVEIARTGDEVSVTGGFYPDTTSCITGKPDGAVVTGPISRGREQETEPES